MSEKALDLYNELSSLVPFFVMINFSLMNFKSYLRLCCVFCIILNASFYFIILSMIFLYIIEQNTIKNNNNKITVQNFTWRPQNEPIETYINQFKSHMFSVNTIEFYSMKVTCLIEQSMHVLHVFSAKSKNPSCVSSSLIKKLARYTNYLFDQW